MAIEQCLKSDEKVLDYGWIEETGRSYTRNVTIRNECDHDVEVSGLFTGDFSGNVGLEGTIDQANLAADWLAFVGGENSFALGAKASKTISIRNYVPADAGGKSYYAMLTLSNKSSEQHDAEYPDAVKLMTRMDVAGGGTVNGSLASNSLSIFRFGGEIKSNAVIKNDGNYGFLAHYKLEKSPAFGLEDYQTVAEEDFEVKSGETRSPELEQVEENQNHYGIYRLRQTIVYTNGEGTRMQSVLTQTVVNLPWVSLFILGGALFALILLLVATKAMKYHKKAKKEDEIEEEKLEDEIKAEKKEEKEKLKRSELDPEEAREEEKESEPTKKAEKAKSKAEKAELKAEQKAKSKAEKAELKAEKKAKKKK